MARCRCRWAQTQSLTVPVWPPLDLQGDLGSGDANAKTLNNDFQGEVSWQRKALTPFDLGALNVNFNRYVRRIIHFQEILIKNHVRNIFIILIKLYLHDFEFLKETAF